MTLITYPTRVHFADGVLEEALHSELERTDSKTVLLVSEEALAEGTFLDRILSGVPARVLSDQLAYTKDANLRDLAYDTAKARSAPDAILAFGSARAIELGRKIRYAVDQTSGKRPTLFGVPGIDGLPDPCTKNLESKQAGLPAVVICDPTVNAGAQTEASVKVAIMSLIRCLESYLSVGYNPPADGIALDGLNRCLNSLDKIEVGDSPDLYRELMAAGLNAFLSQEKGVGPAQTITASLLDNAPDADRAEVARLVTPGVMRARAMDGQKVDILRKVLSDADEPLAEATDRILAGVEMPNSLADAGVPKEALDIAAEAVTGSVGLTYERARTVLEDAYKGG